MLYPRRGRNLQQPGITKKIKMNCVACSRRSSLCALCAPFFAFFAIKFFYRRESFARPFSTSLFLLRRRILPVRLFSCGPASLLFVGLAQILHTHGTPPVRGVHWITLN